MVAGENGGLEVEAAAAVRAPHVERRQDGRAARQAEARWPERERSRLPQELDALAVARLDLVSREQHHAALLELLQRLDPEEGRTVDDDLFERTGLPAARANPLEERDALSVVDHGDVGPERRQLKTRELVVPHVERDSDDAAARSGGALEVLASDGLEAQVLARALLARSHELREEASEALEDTASQPLPSAFGRARSENHGGVAEQRCTQAREEPVHEPRRADGELCQCAGRKQVRQHGEKAEKRPSNNARSSLARHAGRVAAVGSREGGRWGRHGGRFSPRSFILQPRAFISPSF
jgi:hypothetical protein